MHLLIEFHDALDRRRNAEYLLALHENLANEAIDTVHVFVEVGARLVFTSPNLKIIHRRSRPTFGELFEYCNKNLGGELCIIANSDIIFDRTLGLAERICENNVALALSRWDIQYSGRTFEYVLNNNAASQDSWIFRSPVPVTAEMDFHLGTPGCDNRIAKLLRDAGWVVRNPAKRIITAHFHSQQTRTVSSKERVPGPYLFLHPTDQFEGEQPCIEADGFDAQGEIYIDQKPTK